MAKGIDIHFNEPVTVKVVDILQTRVIPFKGIKMLAFDITFKCNVSLPNYIGLGKGVSLGFGMLHRIKAESK